jgi:hypothetical protein
MSRFRPSVAEERWLAVDADPDRTGGWRNVSLIARSGLFVLGALAGGLFAALIELLGPHHGAWFFALLAVASAELLIASRRVFFGGFEEGLELVGAVWFVLELRGMASSNAFWLLGGALSLIGLRLLNPLFTSLGAAACIAALGMTAKPSPILAGVACYAIAVLALAAATLTYRRPSYDRMLGWLIVLAPAGASLTATDTRLILVLGCALGVAALVVGIARRLHAPLLGFLVCVLGVADELRKLSRWPLEARLIVGGGLALLAAVALDRYLRHGRRGITSRAVDSDEAVSMVLAAALPTQAGASNDKFRGGGGTFSGGGASGSY